jgi:hypothetical protein
MFSFGFQNISPHTPYIPQHIVASYLASVLLMRKSCCDRFVRFFFALEHPDKELLFLPSSIQPLFGFSAEVFQRSTFRFFHFLSLSCSIGNQGSCTVCVPFSTCSVVSHSTTCLFQSIFNLDDSG